MSSSFSALILGFLPKCPFCLVLLLAPLGIKVPGSGWFLMYAIVMLAGLPLAFFRIQRCRRSGIGPLIAGVIGFVVMTAGRLTGSGVTTGAGVAMLATGAATMLAAAIWSSRLRGV